MFRIDKKRRCLAFVVLLLAASIFLPLTAQSALSDEQAASDVIVLLDVSQSVLPYFHDITDYVVSSVVKDFLRMGDTFHLLSFGEVAQVEIAQRITGEDDVRSILARLYLLYPLARNTDLISAMGYLYQYLADLPESRSKVVVLITDGVQNPARNSGNYGLSPGQVNAELEAIAARIRSNGWPVYIIKVPFSSDRALAEMKASAGLPAAGGTATAAAGSPAAPTSEEADKLLGTLSSALNTKVTDYSSAEKEEVARKSLSLPVVEFPPYLGKRGYSFGFPLRIHNTGDNEVSLELDRVLSDGVDLLQKKSFLFLAPRKSGTIDIHVALPPDRPTGRIDLPVDLYFADGVRVSPSHGVVSFELAPSPLANLFRSGSTVILFAVFLAIGLAVVFLAVSFILKRVPRRAQAPVVAAVRGSAEAQRPEKKRRPQEAAEAAARRPAATAATAPPAVPPVSPAIPAGLPVSAASIAPPVSMAPMATVRSTSSGAERKAPVPSPAPIMESRSPAPPAGPAKAARPAKARPAKAAEAIDRSSYAPPIVRPGSIELELRVEEQNPSIGLRNVHTIHAGASRSIGGGRSDFLVFLVPVPAHAAQVHFDGERCCFVPLRPELFPGIDGRLDDCLGKDIVMLSRKGYRLVLRFHKYVRPADRVNRLLHCIEAPGLFDSEA